MFASCGIQAAVGKYQALHGISADNVGVDNFINVREGNATIPNGFRVNHQIRAVLALIQTACLVRPDFPLQPLFCELLLEQFLQLGARFGIAAAARMSFGALISADEDVFLKGRHTSTLPHLKVLVG
jgi:hypothetical protein